MTASSSTGLSEQVEYTILPPTASCSTPRTAMRSWSLEDTQDDDESGVKEAPSRSNSPVEMEAVAGGPFLPHVYVLPHGAVSTAPHRADNSSF